MKLPLTLLLSGVVASGFPVLTIQVTAAETTQTAGETSAPTPNWPREITSQGVLLTIYQPQVDSWKDSRLLKARAAFVMTPGQGKPVIGIMELEGPTSTDLEKRTVLIRDMKVTAVRFPSLAEAEVAPTEELFRKVFPARSLTVSLDQLIASVEHSAKPVALKMDPPRILTSEQPALLLLVEDKPILAPVGKGQFIVNANWDVFFDPEGKKYYLLGGSTWYSAPSLDGEWTLSMDLPAFISALPADTQWDHVKKALPPKVERGQKVAQVRFSTEPAELIVFDGSPVWEDIPGIGLMWARNTESHLFRSGKFLYFLTSGRWFRAPEWEGPWSYAGNDLPQAFSQIPHDSPCAEVLASVPGTPEAADAILLATIPREAVVKVAEAEQKASAVYNGEPEFKPISGTTMTYATNTSADVIYAEGHYYLCQNGVWFFSKAASGPWKICTTVPAVIYTIPPSSPVHRVVYVTSEPGPTTDVVVCSYTSGYEGAYIAGVATGAVLVWGTGYYYPPYVAWGKVPVYYPYPATYGAAAIYNPWNGGYAVGQRYYGPYGSAGSAAWYNPNTGNYGRAARVSSPYGSSTIAAGYNPRTDTAWSTRQNYNGYTQWGSSAVSRGDDWLRTGHAVNENGAVVGWQGSEGGGHAWKTDDHSGGTAHHDGDFYAGHDGNVYRRDENGDWAKYDDGDWESVDKPERSHDENLQSQSKDGKNRQKSEQQSLTSENSANTKNSNRRNSSTEGETNRKASTTEGGEGTGRLSGERSEGSKRRAETGTEPRQRPQGEGRPTRESVGNREATEQQRRSRDEYVNRTSNRTQGREMSSDVSRQLNRDSSSRRSGEAREQRSFERHSGGGGGGRHGGREGGRHR